MYWLRAGKVSQMSGVEASPTVFREDGVTVVRGVVPSENFWDARVDVQLLPSGNFVQRRYTVTGAEVFPADPGYTLTNAPYWVFNAGTGVFHSAQIRSLVHLPSGEVTVSVSGRNARLHAFNRSTQTYDLIAMSGSPWTQPVTEWRYTYAQPQTDLVELRLECPDPTEGEVVFAYNGSDGSGSVACSTSQKYDARKTGVYFKRKGELGYADSLVVGKWENAFNLELGSAVVKDDFLSYESDIYKAVCIDETKAGGGKIVMSLGSSKRSGAQLQAETEIELNEKPTGSGYFESKELLLVSDFVDYTFGLGCFSGDPRLFWVEVGGSLNIRYGNVLRSVIVGDGVKSLHVTVVVPTANGVPIIGDVAPAMQAVNERFAQVNVQVVVDSVIQSEQPAGVNVLDGLEFGYYTNNLPISTNRVFCLDDEAKTFLDAFATPNFLEDVRIIFILDIEDVYDFTTGRVENYSGISFSVVDSLIYGNTILVNVNKDHFCIAHELGHILMNTPLEDHSSEPWNLMYEEIVGLGIQKSKRLSGQQSFSMRQNGGLK